MRITRLMHRSSLAAAVAAACLTISASNAAPAAAPPPPPPATRPAQPAPQALGGTVDSFNVDMDGLPNAIMLKDSSGKLVQVNFSRASSSAVAGAVAAGDHITLTAVGRMSLPDHPVYELRGLKGANGQEIKVLSPPVESTIKRLNYSTDGRVDGMVLDSGEFVHIDPREAGQLNLAAGQKVTVDGIVRPSMSAMPVIQATEVNGKSVHPEPMNRSGMGGPMERGGRGPMRDGAMRGGPDDHRGGFEGPEGAGPGGGPGGREHGGPRGPGGPDGGPGGPGGGQGGPGGPPDAPQRQ